MIRITKKGHKSSILLALFIISYDLAGNLIFQSGGGGNLVTGDDYYREYDGSGQLLRVRNGNNASAALLEEYFYDPFGQRIKIKRNDTAQTVVYTPFKELMRVVNSSGTYDFKYIYQDDVLVARVNPDGSKYHYQPDHLGSTTVITDSSGNAVENETYTPYGELLTGGIREENKLYTGQFADEINCQYYYGSRYYNPCIALYEQGDIIIQEIYDPRTLNHYAYTLNNPYKFIDPTGRVVVGYQGFLQQYADQQQAVGINDIIYNSGFEDPAVSFESHLFDPLNTDVLMGKGVVLRQLAANPNQRVVIVGYSLGGNKAVALANDLGKSGIQVDLLVTIDPYQPNIKKGIISQFEGGGQLSVGENVGSAINYYQSGTRFFGGTLSGDGVKNVKVSGVTHGNIHTSVAENVKADIQSVPVQKDKPAKDDTVTRTINRIRGVVDRIFRW